MAGRGSFSPQEIQRIRDDTRISDVIGRFVTWDRKKTNPGRGDWWACCPFHGEKRPSFHCEDGKGRYHCFGCGASGDVFSFLTEKTSMTFPEAVAELGGRAEIVADPAERRRQEEARARRIEEDKAETRRRNESTRERAFRLWKEAAPIVGSTAELYLRNRGIDFDLSFPSLRCHASMRHPETKDRSPCLVAAVQAPEGRFLGIWRIYLTEAGQKLDGVQNEKLGLGAYVEAGGGVRLGPPTSRVNVCEGIETGLGVLGILGGREQVLCGLNTTGLAALQAPPDGRSFLVWPDGDVDKIRRVKRGGEIEERRIESPGLRAARALKERCDGEDFPCAVQPTPKTGRDYLDVFLKLRRSAFHG